MADLNMPHGPYNLTNEEIDRHVAKDRAGNYAFGHMSGNTFYVEYVGRSDNDLNGRIKHGVGQYKHFKFSYAFSAKAAFEKECRNWHDFGGSDSLDNKIHPDKPDFTDLKCPVCGE